MNFYKRKLIYSLVFLLEYLISALKAHKADKEKKRWEEEAKWREEQEKDKEVI